MEDTVEVKKYNIIGKEIVLGKGINSFLLEDINGNKKKLSLQDTLKLVRSDKVSNAKVVLNTVTSEYMIDIDGGLKSLTNISDKVDKQLSILGRLVKNDKCIGYKVKDTDGNIYKLSISKVWELADNGNIKGINAKIISNKKCLISTEDVKLIDIPILKIK